MASDEGKLDAAKLEELHKTMRHVLENLQHMNQEVFGVWFPTGTEADRLKHVEDRLGDLMRMCALASDRYLSLSKRFDKLEDGLRGPRYEDPGRRLGKLEERLAALEETVRKLGGKAP